MDGGRGGLCFPRGLGSLDKIELGDIVASAIVILCMNMRPHLQAQQSPRTPTPPRIVARETLIYSSPASALSPRPRIPELTTRMLLKGC
ncbi:hypothetical protein Tco_0824706 [Tanacetum coccineum]|uniref:Uncharacterized protein n=1 Tax=Tanacetum coccineum TaxID=301880 RepID=A0ABQ5APX5_9ASTR